MAFSNLDEDAFEEAYEYRFRAKELADMAYELAKSGKSPEKVTSLNETANTYINLARLLR